MNAPCRKSRRRLEPMPTICQDIVQGGDYNQIGVNSLLQLGTPVEKGRQTDISARIVPALLCLPMPVTTWTSSEMLQGRDSLFPPWKVQRRQGQI